MLARTGALYADTLRRLRAQLDLPDAAMTASPPDDWPICHGFSPAVLPRPADWPANVHVTGYWWPVGPLRDVTLVQNDWGGAQVLVAHSGSERVARMVLVACEAFDNYPPSIAGRLLVAIARVPGGLALFARLLRFRAVRRAPGWWGWMSKRPVPDEVMEEWFRPAREQAAVRRDLATYGSSVPSREVLLEWAERNRSFTGPVLVVWAAEDRGMPADHGRRLAALYPQGRLVTIPDSYTLVPEDQPAALTAAIRAFLTETRAVAS
ncbi:alpha/beta hydrolase [Pseudonocardia adelaidensis]|uniref:Pimeloyl-ACP methyl ester carboxylesterase n=1 Tax=Pseudonocardia adelaidensis TaxID=648754 RepID=A0ABP9NQ77_9PSEU